MRSHIREVFDKKFELIFDDIKFAFPSSREDLEAKRARQDAVKHLRKGNRFVYQLDLSQKPPKLVKPFTG